MKTPHIDAQKIKDAPAPVIKKLSSTRQSVFERFPIAFTLLGSFGVAATFYGFEGIINKIDFLNNNPFYVLITGIIILIFTGSLYKRLS